jgi:hypothetical protein
MSAMQECKLLIAPRNKKETESDEKNQSLNKAALIRGAGMVVGYESVVSGLSGRSFHAVVLGGISYVAVPGMDLEQQNRFERLLSWAEPITHDNWIPSAEMLRNWRGARVVVSRVRDTYRKAIRDATFEQIPSTEGNAAPELSKMFPLNPGPTKDAEKRDINIEVTKSPYKIDNDDVGQNRYGFEVKVVVPSKQKFHKTPKPDNWRITCKYGFYGEGRRLRIIDHAKLRIIKVISPVSEWINPDQQYQLEAKFEDSVHEKDQVYQIIGETESLDPRMSQVTKHDLEIDIDRGKE